MVRHGPENVDMVQKIISSKIISSLQNILKRLPVMEDSFAPGCRLADVF